MSHIWRQVCTIATIILLVLVVLLSQFGSPLAGLVMERQVYSLLQEQGYGDEDIQDIRIRYNPKERHVYTAEVVFQDHGGYMCYFMYNGNQELQELERLSK